MLHRSQHFLRPNTSAITATTTADPINTSQKLLNVTDKQPSQMPIESIKDIALLPDNDAMDDIEDTFVAQSDLCFFLNKIPAKLRTAIYEHALTADDAELTLEFKSLGSAQPELSFEEQRIKTTERIRKLEAAVDQLKSKVAQHNLAAEQARSLVTSLSTAKPGSLWARKENDIKLQNAEHEQMHSEMEARNTTQHVEKHEELLQNVLNGDTSFLKSKPNSTTAKHEHVFRDVDSVFALTRTCKQIHKECSELAYELNQIKFVSQPSGQGQLKQIAYHENLQKLDRGIILDLGVFDAQGGHIGICQHITNNQGPLRKIHKSTTSVALQFVLDCPRLPVGSWPKEDWKSVLWGIELTSPEAVVEQCEILLLAESEHLKRSRMEEIKRRVVTTFWPIWAVRNLRTWPRAGVTVE